MPISVRRLIALTAPCVLALSCATPPPHAPDNRPAPPTPQAHRLILHETWQFLGDSAWCGPELLTWPMDAWHVAAGVLTASPRAADPVVAAIGTLRIVNADEPISIRMELGLPAEAGDGLLTGIVLGLPDPLAATTAPLPGDHAILFAGINGHGAAILEPITPAEALDELATRRPPGISGPPPARVTLRLYARRGGNTVTAVLSILDETGREFARTSAWQLDPALCEGYPALFALGDTAPVHWRQAVIGADAADYREDHIAGPLLGAWFTHDGDRVELTVQRVPLAPLEPSAPILEWFRNDTWEQAAAGQADADTGRIRFRVAPPANPAGLPYRIGLPIRGSDGRVETHYRAGHMPAVPPPGSPIRIAMLPLAEPGLIEKLDPHLLAWARPEGPLLPVGAPFDEASRAALMRVRDLLRDRPVIGIETNATRYGQVWVGLLPQAEAPVDTETDWANWRGVQHVLRLAPDMFTQAADTAGLDRATAAGGSGLVTLDTATGNVTLSRIPEGSGPGHHRRAPDGWPLVFRPWPAAMPEVFGHLPPVRVTGLPAPVVQVIDADNRLVYSFRAEHPVILPRVARDGRYRLRIGEPGTEHQRIVDDLAPLGADAGIPDPALLVFDTAPPTEESP